MTYYIIEIMCPYRGKWCTYSVDRFIDYEDALKKVNRNPNGSKFRVVKVTTLAIIEESPHL